MKKHASILRTLACLLLIGCTVLCGCPAPNDGGTTSTTTTTTTTTGGSQNPDAPTPTVYGNGGAIEGTGDRLASDAPVLTAPSYSTEGATEKTSAQMRAILRNANGVTADTVYVTTDEEAIGFIGANDRAYEGKNAVIVSKGGFLIDDCANIVIRNITLVGPALIQKSANVTFENVKFVCADGTAIKADAESSKIYLKNCRMDAAVAVENNANDLYLLDSYISFTANGILDLSEKNLYIRGNRFVGTAGAAIKTASQDAEIRKNTITLLKDSTAIEIGETKNVLVAENIIKDAQKAVLMIGADNSVIVRNSLISVEMKNSKHAYICDNAMGGKIIVSDIDYILADGNTYPDDEYNHATDGIGITNSNGDSLMDVSENNYLSAGANENLLPHVDRDQFFGEERKTVVRDPDGDMEFGSYVMAHAKTDSVIIIAPGAYKTYEAINLGKEHSDTTLYAYGAFSERSATAPAGHTGSYEKLDNHFDMDYAERVTVKGGTYGYEYQGHGQGHIIEKIPGTAKVRLKASAGFIDDIGLSNPSKFNSTTYIYRSGVPYFYGDTQSLSGELLDDGTVLLELYKEFYDMAEVGDVLTTRPAHGTTPVSTDYCTDIRYQDITVFATMAAVCFHEYYNENSVTYFRCADTYRPGVVITKETYDEYKAFEAEMQKKGYTDFTTEVWYDDAHDCYRGPSFRNASLDGVHVVSSKGGAQILSSLFERLGDDGTNQFATCVRLSALRDNGDGTVDLIFKGLISDYWYHSGPKGNSSTRTPHLTGKPPVTEGSKIIIYTAGGNLVLDAIALTDEENAHRLKNDADLIAEGGEQYIKTKHVKAKINEYHADVLAEYLPYLDEYTDDKDAILDSGYNSYHNQYKVYFHIGGFAAEGARVENTKVDCVRSRAALFRASESTIKNCTYMHVGSPAIGVIFEPFWGGESAVVQNMTLENNLIVHTGYAAPTKKEKAPISIDAPGDLDISRSPLFRNIVIRGNVFKDRANDWAIFVDGVAGVTIENNDLGRIVEMEGLTKRNLAIYIQNSTNVKIEGNKYPNPTMPIKNAITLDNVKGLTGKDVNGGDLFPDCK